MDGSINRGAIPVSAEEDQWSRASRLSGYASEPPGTAAGLTLAFIENVILDANEVIFWHREQASKLREYQQMLRKTLMSTAEVGQLEVSAETQDLSYENSYPTKRGTPEYRE